MRSRINLTIDPKIAHRAKQYAKREKTSLSAIVEEYLDTRTKGNQSEANRSLTFTEKWKGTMTLKSGETDDRLNKLKEKYG